MLSDEKILKLISLILLNIIIVLASSFVFSNLAYAQFLNDKTLEGITHYSPTEYPHINVGKRPVAIGVNSNYREDIHLVYVVDSKDDIVSIIDGINNTNTRNDIKVGNKPVAIGVNNFTNTIYVANSEDNTVTVIDGINNTKVKDIPVGGGPFAIGVNNFTNTIYVANYKNNTVSVINGKYNNNTGNDIKVGDGPNSIGVDEFTHMVYVANFKNNTVTVIDGLNNTRVKDIPVGDRPTSIGVDSLTDSIYVTNSYDGIVSKYHYAIKSLYNENKIDEHDMERLDKLKYDIDNDYAEGKIGDKQYENTKNEISILYEKIFRKMINSMENLSDKEVAKKQFNGIAKYIDLVYSEGKLSELHYNLLMKRFPNSESL